MAELGEHAEEFGAALASPLAEAGFEVERRSIEGLESGFAAAVVARAARSAGAGRA